MDIDVLIIGGGPAGAAAARAASEEGMKVILVEKCGFLGGNLTSSLVGTIGGLFVREGDSIDYAVGGIPQDCAETLKSRGLAYGPIPWEQTAVLPHAPWGVKKLFDEWIERAENVKLMLHTSLVGADIKDREVSKVTLQRRNEQVTLSARAFVDASGDGDLFFLCGAAMEDSPVQFPTLNFYMHNVNIAEALTAGLATLQKLIREAVQTGEYDLPRAGGAVIPTMRPGEVIVAMGRVAIDGQPVDCTDPEQLTLAEIEGRKQAVLLSEFLKAKMPGFADAYLSDTPCKIGIRSTRRLSGRYRLRREDVLGAADFPDSICRCAWPIELHLEGKETVLEFPPPGKTYAIPFKALLPVEFDNLVVAGRCLSATVEGQGSARVSATAMGMGEAAGVACAIACENNTNVADVEISALQERLKRRGVLL